MDNGDGRFVKLEDGVLEEALEGKYPKHGGWFREGEIVELKGSTFVVKRIKPTEITLKLVKRKVKP